MRNVFVGIASLWPGAAQAWLTASGRGLLLAVGFAVALNLALLGTFAWPRWPAPLPAGSTAAVAWLLVLVLWGLGLTRLRRDWSRLASQPPAQDPELESQFAEAQRAYLKGHWVEAETLIGCLLARQPSDIEARLLLASIQRRTGRLAQAMSTLVELQQCEGVGKWPLEIDRELALLTERRTGQGDYLENAKLAGEELGTGDLRRAA